jgi:hypothetical protein
MQRATGDGCTIIDGSVLVDHDELTDGHAVPLLTAN